MKQELGTSILSCNPMIHIGNVAGGANWEFPKCKGGQNLYNVLTFQKFKGGKSLPRGEMPLFAPEFF